jgi:hypothetical protein
VKYFITLPPRSKRKFYPSSLLNTKFIFTPTLEPYLSLIWGFRPGQNNPALNPPKSHTQRYFQMGASCFLKMHFYSLLTTKNFRTQRFTGNQTRNSGILSGFSRVTGIPEGLFQFLFDSFLPILK